MKIMRDDDGSLEVKGYLVSKDINVTVISEVDSVDSVQI